MIKNKIQKIITDNPLVAAQFAQDEYSDEFALFLKDVNVSSFLPLSKIARTRNAPTQAIRKHMAAVCIFSAGNRFPAQDAFSIAKSAVF